MGKLTRVTARVALSPSKPIFGPSATDQNLCLSSASGLTPRRVALSTPLRHVRHKTLKNHQNSDQTQKNPTDRTIGKKNFFKKLMNFEQRAMSRKTSPTSGGIGPIRSQKLDRATSKPLMEKRRRERINRSLNELKNILLEALRRDTTSCSKLEKADILEMTVRYLHSTKTANGYPFPGSQSNPVPNPAELQSRYTSGYSHCRDQTERILSQCPELSQESRKKILSQLRVPTGPVVPVPKQNTAIPRTPVPQSPFPMGNLLPNQIPNPMMGLLGQLAIPNLPNHPAKNPIQARTVEPADSIGSSNHSDSDSDTNSNDSFGQPKPIFRPW